MIPSKPQFVGKKIRLEELLQDTFAGEWGTETGENLTPVLRTSNFREDGSFNYDAPAMRCIPEKKVAKKRMLRGDIILEKSGGTPKRPVGIMAFYDSDDLALCSNFNQVLRFDESKIQPRFAFYQLRWLKEHNAFERYTRKTTGLQNLQIKKFIEHDIWVPTEEVQSRIVALLDAISNNQTQLNQQIHRFDSLVKSRFVEMFGTLDSNPFSLPVKKMGEVAEQLIAGGDKPTDITVQKDKNHVYPVYANGVIDGGIQGYSSKARVNKPAVTIAARGTIGFCCIRDAGFTPVVRLISMVPDSSLDLTYLKYYIDSLNLAGSGTSQAQLTVPDFRMKPILIPKISDQHKFAALVAQVDKSRFVAQQQIEKLQLLYDSLAQEYFGD